MRTVQIFVSKSYDLFGGPGMQNLGRKRDYTAEIDGVKIKNTVKSEIETRIRHKLHPERVRFEFVQK